jgi:hypothetical protein
MVSVLVHHLLPIGGLFFLVLVLRLLLLIVLVLVAQLEAKVPYL